MDFLQRLLSGLEDLPYNAIEKIMIDGVSRKQLQGTHAHDVFENYSYSDAIRVLLFFVILTSSLLSQFPALSSLIFSFHFHYHSAH